MQPITLPLRQSQLHPPHQHPSSSEEGYPFPAISRFTELSDRYAGELLTRRSSISSWGAESSIKELDLARNQIATTIQSRYTRVKNNLHKYTKELGGGGGGGGMLVRRMELGLT